MEIADNTSTQETIGELHAFRNRLAAYVTSLQPPQEVYLVVTAASDMLFVDLVDEDTGTTETLAEEATLGALIRKEGLLRNKIAERLADDFPVPVSGADNVLSYLFAGAGGV